jgi:hypothetical protein
MLAAARSAAALSAAALRSAARRLTAAAHFAAAATAKVERQGVRGGQEHQADGQHCRQEDTTFHREGSLNRFDAGYQGLTVGRPAPQVLFVVRRLEAVVWRCTQQTSC